MATEIRLSKTAGGTLAPADQQAVDYVSRLKLGQPVKATIVRPRNIRFHKKYFALLQVAFDAWEPPAKQYKGETVQKNFEQFRRDITILSGHYDVVYTLKEEVRFIPKSISFANMDEDEFSALYEATITVVLHRILRNYTREDLDNVVEQVLAFG